MRVSQIRSGPLDNAFLNVEPERAASGLLAFLSVGFAFGRKAMFQPCLQTAGEFPDISESGPEQFVTGDSRFL
jgi:hypothetical protein